MSANATTDIRNIIGMNMRIRLIMNWSMPLSHKVSSPSMGED